MSLEVRKYKFEEGDSAKNNVNPNEFSYISSCFR